MGNRAVITFAAEPTKNSLGIYLHWNGGAESVLAFVEAADRLGVRTADEGYAIARTVQIIGNFFGGTLSVGVGTLGCLDCDNGDNGLFVVTRGAGKEPCIRQHPDGDWRNDGVILNNDEIRKHRYWKPDEDGKTLLDGILEKNAAHFAKKD